MNLGRTCLDYLIPKTTYAQAGVNLVQKTERLVSKTRSNTRVAPGVITPFECNLVSQFHFIILLFLVIIFEMSSSDYRLTPIRDLINSIVLYSASICS